MLNSTTRESAPGHVRRFHLFRPILVGATLHERLIACLGALLSIGLTGAICGSIYGNSMQLPMLVAPMGASAVLLFAVPTSPLAQPWSIIGGNTISALMGVIVAHLVHDQILAVGLAVSLAIAAMSFTRCLHPPGGAAALTAVLGGHAITASGFLFPFIPVGLNSLILVSLGIMFHMLSKREYPHVVQRPPVNTHGTADQPAQLRVAFCGEDIDAALAALDESFDINRDDLDRLLRQVELESMIRSKGELLCEDIMSRDVIHAAPSMPPATARALLLAHNIRTLPVLDANGALLGTVGLRELERPGAHVAQLVADTATASASTPAAQLVPVLTDGKSHAVVIIDAERHVLGLITQTDLLAAMTRP